MREQTLILFQCHDLNPATLAAFEHLHASVAGRYPLEIMIDRKADNGELPALPVPVFVFDSRQFNTWGFPTHGDSMLPGHCHFPLLRYAQLREFQFKHIWVVEYDVRFSGDWREFFDHFKDSDADLLCCHLKDREHDPGWYFWDTYQAPAGPDADGVLLRSFLVVSRYSRAAIESTISFYQQGGKGHQEVVLPMAAYLAGLVVQDINWSCADGRRRGNGGRRFYTTYSDLDGRIEYFGTVRWRPALSTAPRKGQRLYHPVKSISRGQSAVNENTVADKLQYIVRLIQAHISRVVRKIDRRPLRLQRARPR